MKGAVDFYAFWHSKKYEDDEWMTPSLRKRISDVVLDASVLSLNDLVRDRADYSVVRTGTGLGAKLAAEVHPPALML